MLVQRVSGLWILNSDPESITSYLSPHPFSFSACPCFGLRSAKHPGFSYWWVVSSLSMLAGAGSDIALIPDRALWRIWPELALRADVCFPLKEETS